MAIAGVVGAAALVAALIVAMPRDDASSRASSSVSARAASARALATTASARRETRPTLAPATFTGEAAAAYRVAREIPDVLDALTCYCSCRDDYGHVSLLSCYTDGHAAT